MTDYGKAPIQIEVIEGDITLKTECRTLSVWAISAEGLYVGKVPAQYTEEGLKFHIGDKFPSMYYLIQAE